MKGQRLTGRIEGLLLGLMLVALVVLAVVTVGGRFWWLPTLASQHGKAIDTLFTVTLIVTGIVFVLCNPFSPSWFSSSLEAKKEEPFTSPRTEPLNWSGQSSLL